jgi:cytochrome c peroxidase
MNKPIYLLLIIFIGMVSFQTMQPLFVVPKNWPSPTYDFKNNKLTQAKINIGRALFYDNILSKDNSVSCASCHLSYNAFAHTDHDLSHGIYSRIGTRNAPAIFNLAWGKKFMWDGAINNLDAQALAPIHSPIEMDENIDSVLIKLNASQLYKNLFYTAYKDSVINTEKMLKCISQFILTIQSFNSKYDSVMLDQKQFTSNEEHGYKLFKQYCNSCHTEPLFTNHSFATNGLKVDATLNDWGRYTITKLPQDSLLFKIPTLRNIQFTSPYMHDGRFFNIMEVLNHYTGKIIQYKNLPTSLRNSITLSEIEKRDLLAFLSTLSDNKFLYKEDYQFPKKILLPANE